MRLIFIYKYIFSFTRDYFCSSVVCYSQPYIFDCVCEFVCDDGIAEIHIRIHTSISIIRLLLMETAFSQLMLLQLGA